MSEVDRIKKIIPIMNQVSESFCMAKWYHSGIYLHTGQTHSCYHPRPHEISLEEIKTNPSALHNTSTKKKERAMMLVGEKPSGCQYCWNVEGLSDTHISDRMIRNESIYTPERLKEITDNTWKYDINPEYIEIAFSNECNFKCGYCHPMSSSSFASEIKIHGPIKTVKNHNLDISWFKPYEEDQNPYVDAWWRWWPELSKTLNILRITGGEPLMHRTTWKLFEHLRNEPKPHLELNLNSNLGIKAAMVEKLAENVNDLLVNNKIKTFKLFTSMDTWGKRAEYIRTGLNLEVWEKNFDTYITQTKRPVTFMCTFNILSVTSFTDFLEKILEWRRKYQPLLNPGRYGRRIHFDTPYLKEPLQYDMNILPKDQFLPYFDKILKFIEDNKDEYDPTKFTEIEFEKFRRVRDYFATAKYDEKKVNEGRKDFYNWFIEYDKRRNVNFLETFPDMTEFYMQCRDLANG
jgi:organic radical activating enzyme